MAMGSVEEAAAPKFYKHTAVFPGFLFLGVWPPPAIALLCLLSSSRMQGGGILCLCPRAVTLGRARGQECSCEEEFSPGSLVRGSWVQSPTHAQVHTESEWILGPLFCFRA